MTWWLYQTSKADDVAELETSSSEEDLGRPGNDAAMKGVGESSIDASMKERGQEHGKAEESALVASQRRGKPAHHSNWALAQFTEHKAKDKKQSLIWLYRCKWCG